MPVQAAEDPLYESQSLLETLTASTLSLKGQAGLVTVITVCTRDASLYF